MSKPKKILMFTLKDGFPIGREMEIATLISKTLSKALGERVMVLVGPDKITPINLQDFKKVLRKLK